MDFSKYSQNEKLMLYGAVAAVIGGIVGGISSVIWITVLAGIALIAVLVLPQLSPTTSLPGSRGSLLVAVGGVGAVAAALALLTVIVDIGFWFDFSAVRTIFFLVGVAGALFAGWLAWQEFQAEGGKFTLGTATSGGTAAAPPPAASPDAGSPAPSERGPDAPVATPPPVEPPMGSSSAPPPDYAEEEDRPRDA
jgi:hypothetical protein